MGGCGWALSTDLVCPSPSLSLKRAAARMDICRMGVNAGVVQCHGAGVCLDGGGLSFSAEWRVKRANV